MLTLHHLNDSRSFRILWLLCELNALYGTSFRVIKHERTKSYLAPKELSNIHPMGKAPILIDESCDKTLAESGFIIEYLLRHYDTQAKLSPSDEAWEDYAFWLHFTESSLMPNLVMRLVFAKIVQKSPFFIRPIVKNIQKGVEKSFISPNVDKALALLNEHLANRRYLSGAGQGIFGAVDIHLHFGIAQMKKSGVLFDEWVHIHNWLAYCQSRPGFEMAQNYE